MHLCNFKVCHIRKVRFQAGHYGYLRVSTYFTKLSLSEVTPSEQAVQFGKNSFPSHYWRGVKSTCSDWPTIYELPRCSLIMFQNAKWFFHSENCSQLMFPGNERSGLTCPLWRRRDAVRINAMYLGVNKTWNSHPIEVWLPIWDSHGKQRFHHTCVLCLWSWGWGERLARICFIALGTLRGD